MAKQDPMNTGRKDDWKSEQEKDAQGKDATKQRSQDRDRAGQQGGQGREASQQRHQQD
jgi:hypothetical protein